MAANNGTTVVDNGSSTLEIGQSNQDLILSNTKRKKRMWIIGSITGAVAIALVITAIVILVKAKKVEEEAITLNLEDFLNYKYNPKSFNGTWVSGNKFLYTDSDGNLLLYNLETSGTSTLLTFNDSIILTAFDFSMSANGEYLLVAYDYQKLYRHSYRAKYIIVNLSTNMRIALETEDSGIDFFLVQWSPVGSAFAYVYRNNIYHKESPESTVTTALTNTSSTEFIFNGIPDWVYEEEIFSSNKALWFSGDGRKIAYARFNDNNVEAMVVPIYGEPGTLYSQYPRANFVKYPKAGTTNPTVELFVYDIDSKNTTELAITSNLESAHIINEKPGLNFSEPILAAVTWATNNSLVAVWMNRRQNQANVVVYADLSATPTTVKAIEETAGWVELFVPPIISKSGTQMALLLSKNEGTTTGSYRHLALLDITDGANAEFLTNGTYVVTEVLGWNHDENLIYYTATVEDDSSVQHIYSVSPVYKNRTCISCSLKSKNGGNNCLYNTGELSTDASHLVFTCSGPDVPHIAIHSVDGTEKLLWSGNEDLVGLLQGKTLHGKVKLEYDIADGFTGRVLLKLPPNLDTSGNTKYPMLVNVYGGPDTYQVTDKYSIDWGSYLAANKSIIYATIDGRGSGLRGNNLLYAGYRKLGTVEVIDQINITKLIQQNLPYVDATRTGIWGWSYGGYAAGMALATDTDDVFKCGISVAPVTDWALYGK
ncbi:hypothetical protein HUJ04_003003 [Dendroctonus ponderosae]|nr:hypothetical protein HUJ04_003003 [Dendroctonus ponderosae]